MCGDNAAIYGDNASLTATILAKLTLTAAKRTTLTLMAGPGRARVQRNHEARPRYRSYSTSDFLNAVLPWMMMMMLTLSRSG